MEKSILLITPPFTQLNTPYPATAYLKGFLNTLNINSYQVDLGIEVILKLFTQERLSHLFDNVDHENIKTLNCKRIFALKNEYINTIDLVIEFLQNNNPTLAYEINEGEFLPEASRFQQNEDLEWAFGSMGIRDKARHLCTLYLEDLADFIAETTDDFFGFSRYAERLGMSANSFDKLYGQLNGSNTFIDDITLDLLHKYIKQHQPHLVTFSIPFPGNLYSAFKCAQFIKQQYPNIKIAFGGGYPNTELRSLSDERVFEFTDYIMLDDGERPFVSLLKHLDENNDKTNLTRTFSLNKEGKVEYFHNKEKDFSLKDVGTPDYSDLPLKNYLSVIEVINPMHRLWSDGRWNKLTLAHGCYWGKCTFCDISLDYIALYEPISAKIICDRIEQIIDQTNETGFHFVDEAAPPSLMKEVAIEIIKRGIKITWWTNIRFEKSFTADLCKLLKASGCIAVSGGLEVASNRLLKLIDKGVTVEQVTKVAQHFTEANIMVHAYLMYGFPTQTTLETINSLEVVRQLTENGIVQSGFWHQFAMTAHSPVGLNPEKFNVENLLKKQGTFANNDLPHKDTNGANHIKFSQGLKTSLFNYMNGAGFDLPLQNWFDFKIPKPTLAKDYILQVLETEQEIKIKPNTRVLWLGNVPILEKYEKTKKGKVKEMARVIFHNKKEDVVLNLNFNDGLNFMKFISQISLSKNQSKKMKDIENLEYFDFYHFMNSENFYKVKQDLLLV